MPLDAIIIDDKAGHRQRLTRMLQAQKEIRHIDETGSVSEAKARLQQNMFDLVFLNLRLSQGNGLDLIPFIDASSKLMFITGDHRSQIQAFEADLEDWFRPVTRSRIANTVNQLTSATTESDINTIRKRISVKINSDYWFVNLEKIIVIYSVGGNYVALNLKDEERLICRKTLKEWEEVLPGSVFVRIHRSTIVNTHFIKRISYKKDGSCTLFLSHHDETFSVSRRFAPRFKEMVEAQFPAPSNSG